MAEPPAKRQRTGASKTVYIKIVEDGKSTEHKVMSDKAMHLIKLCEFKGVEAIIKDCYINFCVTGNLDTTALGTHDELQRGVELYNFGEQMNDNAFCNKVIDNINSQLPRTLPLIALIKAFSFVKAYTTPESPLRAMLLGHLAHRGFHLSGTYLINRFEVPSIQKPHEMLADLLNFIAKHPTLANAIKETTDPAKQHRYKYHKHTPGEDNSGCIQPWSRAIENPRPLYGGNLDLGSRGSLLKVFNFVMSCVGQPVESTNLSWPTTAILPGCNISSLCICY